MKRSLYILALCCFFVVSQASRAQMNASPTKIEQKKPFNVVGIAVRTNNQQEAGGSGEIPKLWQRFTEQEIAAKILNRADQNLLVVYTDYQSDQTGEYTYLIGARVTSTADVPAGLTLKEIPASSYAVLETDKGPLQTVIPALWKRILSMPAKDLGGERAFQADYEIMPQGVDRQNAQIAIYVGLK
jgi:predicted transcriptional regulator YdeE